MIGIDTRAAYSPTVAMRLALPAHATIDDPIFGPHLRLLAQDLIFEQARLRLVCLFTGLCKKEASRIYYAIHQKHASPGPIPRSAPAFFVNGQDSNHGAGPIRNLHSTIFLNTYRQLEQVVGDGVNRGWLLLNAYRAYRRLTIALEPAMALNINQCYALVQLAGRPQLPETAEVAIVVCDKCQRNYLVATAKEVATQECPLCKMAGNTRRLHAQLKQINARRALSA